MAVKVLCLDLESEVFNTELFGKMMFNIVGFISPIKHIKSTLMKVLEKTPNHNLKKIADNLNVKLFDFFTSKVRECFKGSVFDMVVKRGNLKISGAKNKSEFGRNSILKVKKSNIIYWLKNKVSTAVDLARISFSRIEERSDEVLK